MSDEEGILEGKWAEPCAERGIKMSTPSGRFHTDCKICTSMSDFHPGSWNPAWSVANMWVEQLLLPLP